MQSEVGDAECLRQLLAQPTTRVWSAMQRASIEDQSQRESGPSCHGAQPQLGARLPQQPGIAFLGKAVRHQWGSVPLE